MIYLLTTTDKLDINSYNYYNVELNKLIINTETKEYIQLYRNEIKPDKNYNLIEKTIAEIGGKTKQISQELYNKMLMESNITIDKIKYEETNQMKYKDLIILSDTFINVMYKIMLNNNNKILASYTSAFDSYYYNANVPKYLLGSTKELSGNNLVYSEPGHKLKLFNIYHNPMVYINDVLESQKRLIKNSRKELQNLIIQNSNKRLRNSIHYKNNKTVIDELTIKNENELDLYKDENYKDGIGHIIDHFLRDTYANILLSFSTKKVAGPLVGKINNNYYRLENRILVLYILIYLGKQNISYIMQEIETIYNELTYDIIRPKNITEIMNTKNDEEPIVGKAIYTLYNKVNNLSFPDELENMQIKNADEITENILAVLKTTIR